MPLLMPSQLRPDRERRLPAAQPGPQPEPSRRSPGTRSTTPTRTTSTATTWRWSAGREAAVRQRAAQPVQRQARGAARAGRSRQAPARACPSGCCTTSSGCSPAARPTSSTTTSRATSSRATCRRRASSAPRSGRGRRARGSCCCSTPWASTTASSASWALPQGRQRRLHPGARPGRAVVRCRDQARRRRSSRCITTNGRATGVALADGTELHADTVVVSALDPRRTFLELVDPRELPDDLVENIQRYRYQGTSSKVNFALDGLPEVPVARRSQRHVPRLHQHRHRRWTTSSGPSTRPSTAGTRRGRTSTAAIQSTIDPDMAPPGKHVMSCFIHYTPYQLKGSDWDTEREQPRRHRAGHARVVLPRVLATSCCSARSSRRSTSSGPSACRRATSSPASSCRPQMYFFRPAPGWNQYRTPIDGYCRHPAGTSTARRSTATTSAGRAPIRVAASRADRGGSPRSRSCATWPDPARRPARQQAAERAGTLVP